MKKQGEIYVNNDADKWFERNKYSNHNCFTEYLTGIFPKSFLRSKTIAEFGVGRGNNILFLSNYAQQIDGYDGSSKAIDNLKKIKESRTNIDGIEVNLGEEFVGLRTYDIIIFGFFTYMLSNEEFKILVENSKRLLNRNGYIYVYDFLSETMIEKVDSHNDKLKVFKRNIGFYLDEMKDFYLQDFKLWDNSKLNEYMSKDNQHTLDLSIESDDYNWTFSSLFKLR
ncbi:class I SAM-dependent methyltransferase [Mariniflexile litorale]|uniref:Class I SAM-dependent methyltransferase n=1 Tax=Mariniflexile litorale TaxID=3045158 RepID=A0AAU7EI14_9FLAO|nr:class I SAM-dependent methyltransferase [Mariniflexile sp. KMM 9835]MDQ8211332.1 class I SAM-dependent methyltransferase [Mariniflexile sp. KMM 9835]